ncbi:acyl carrier protein [Sphingomonas sp.]|uniref:acyl carrier protein n=1 Tax=Sphingomonas sp. TaxID=28214 RepID=UPI003AFFAC8C
MPPSRDDVLAIISEEARIDPAKLEPSATLASLGIASLDVVSVLFAVEDRFGVEVPVEALGSAETLDQFVDVILSRIAAA